MYVTCRGHGLVVWLCAACCSRLKLDAVGHITPVQQQGCSLCCAVLSCMQAVLLYILDAEGYKDLPIGSVSCERDRGEVSCCIWHSGCHFLPLGCLGLWNAGVWGSRVGGGSIGG
jgi:hypothetical protein